YVLTRSTGQPPTLMLLGGAVSLISAMAVNDPDRRQQKITFVLLPLPAMAAISAGAALAPWRIAGDAAFVAIAFAAVYVRRFGPRGFALGMLAFITYFIGLFLAPRVTSLPWLFIAICVGSACSFLLRYAVLPDRPLRDLERMLRAFTTLIGRVLDEVIKSLASETPDDRRRRAIRWHLPRLIDTAIALEIQLEQVLPDEDQPNPLRARLALAVLDLELATERIVRISAGVLEPAVRARAVDALRALRLQIRRRELSAAAELPTVRALESSLLERAIQRLAAAFVAMSDERVDMAALAGSQVKVRPPATARSADSGDSARDASAAAEVRTERLAPSTRQAIQVAVAGALAIAAGELVSPRRWYWAAITAFVVFTGTNSRGETLLKGWQRIAGTLAGVAAGVLIGTVVHGERRVDLMLMFVCIFLAFYLLRVSYGLMIFWITILVALLYSLFGFFSPQLLVLRLEETAIGAAVGVLVAVLLLPASTRSRVRDESREFLIALAGLVEDCGEQLLGDYRSGDLTATTRALDRRFQQLRAAAKPLTRGIAGAFARKGARRWLRSLLVCRYYAANLARVTQQAPMAMRGLPSADRLREAVAHVSANIRALAGMSEDTDRLSIESSAARIERLMEVSPGTVAVSGSEVSPQLEILRSLERIDRVVVALAQDFGPIAHHKRVRRGTSGGD
ncbi:MAG TPA: FUSC family protein, partial [Nitrococcus sp.]|nr:FUSC family protein [Nitrococcus sp.]